MSNICKNCGASVAESDAVYCPTCGAFLVKEPPLSTFPAPAVREFVNQPAAVSQKRPRVSKKSFIFGVVSISLAGIAALLFLFSFLSAASGAYDDVVAILFAVAGIVTGAMGQSAAHRQRASSEEPLSGRPALGRNLSLAALIIASVTLVGALIWLPFALERFSGYVENRIESTFDLLDRIAEEIEKYS